METDTQFLQIIPVLPSADISRDITWYQDKTGFTCVFSDDMYAALHRENIRIHLQWHANTEADPLHGGAVIRIFVKNIKPLFDEFCQRGTVSRDKFVSHTPWKTNEFGFYDLNNNALFVVEDIN